MDITLLVDVSSLAARAFYTGQGLFFRMIEKVVAEFNQPRIVFCFDGTSNWRKEYDPTYKANRNDATKRARTAYLRTLWRALSATGHICAYDANLEADDIIAELATQMPSIIVTSDKDLFGVISPDCQVYWIQGTFDNRELIGPAEFKSKFGFDVGFYYAWKAMVGDPGDNIKGVPGIGPVNATKLIQEYGEGIYSLEELPFNDPNLIKLQAGWEAFDHALSLVQPRMLGYEHAMGLTGPHAPQGTLYNSEAEQIWRQLK